MAIRVNKYISFLGVFALALFIAACNTSGEKEGEGTINKNYYGGVLRESVTDHVQTLCPPSMTDGISFILGSQIYEGLLKFDPKTLEVLPNLASSWTVNESGRVYTFNIKKGVFFHDNLCFREGKGREVTAKDFEFCFKMLCTNAHWNFNYKTTFRDRVLGAKAYYDSSNTNTPLEKLEGVRVIDDHTLEIELIKPDNTFLFLLANPFTAVYPKEAFDIYNAGIKVGTGPFVFEEGKSMKGKVVLSRNPKYHRKDSLGNTLPYLDSIIVLTVEDKEKELAMFKNKELDFMIGLPVNTVSNVVQNEIKKFKGDSAAYMLERMPEMLTQFYTLNVAKAPFDNVKVRQAFSYAINRKKIVEDVLSNEAYGPGIYGITPPAIRDYDVEQVQGYSFNPEKAKALLAEAGYPNGKGFPKVKLELNSGGNKHTEVALAIQEQLKSVLGVNIEFEVVSLAQKLEDANHGKAEMFRSGWVADYPNPESFLSVVYGGTVPDSFEEASFPNNSRYKNEVFDSLYNEAKSKANIVEANKKYLEAENLVMQDAPIIVLWYDESYRLSHTYVKNYQNNPMRYRDYSNVYIEK